MHERTTRLDLRRLSLAELRAAVLAKGLPEFRYRQIARWLYDKGVESLSEMTDLSRELRDELSRDWEIAVPRIAAHVRSSQDGSEKVLFQFADGAAVESVLMPTEKRITLCISTQVGCTLDCAFCQTGRMGFSRNLRSHEIIAQILPLWRRIRDLRTRTNIVFMGMGEPLHNLREIRPSLRLLLDPLGLGLGPKRITVSTAGVVPGIRQLAATGFGVGLGISLNATTDSLRRRLMPRAARWSISQLLRSAREYAAATGTRVTFEYVLIRGLNDTPEDADRLARLTRGGPFKINLIPYNPGASEEFVRPERERVDSFAERLYPQAPTVTVRWSLGGDIAAACGQLRTRLLEENRGNEAGRAQA
jgi:23S rRNA (adenine2503-C2)-methyltransferase